MTDRVRYDLVGGRQVDGLFVRPDLRRIFEFRQQQIPRLFGLGDDACRCRQIEFEAL